MSVMFGYNINAHLKSEWKRLFHECMKATDPPSLPRCKADFCYLLRPSLCSWESPEIGENDLESTT